MHVVTASIETPCFIQEGLLNSDIQLLQSSGSHIIIIQYKRLKNHAPKSHKLLNLKFGIFKVQKSISNFGNSNYASKFIT